MSMRRRAVDGRELTDRGRYGPIDAYARRARSIRPPRVHDGSPRSIAAGRVRVAWGRDRVEWPSAARQYRTSGEPSAGGGGIGLACDHARRARHPGVELVRGHALAVLGRVEAPRRVVAHCVCGQDAGRRVVQDSRHPDASSRHRVGDVVPQLAGRRSRNQNLSRPTRLAS